MLLVAAHFGNSKFLILRLDTKAKSKTSNRTVIMFLA